MSAASGVSPAVSVVLPVYRNREQLPELLERLRAVLEAASGGWEIVFVDDCGADGSREWIAERARDDARLVLLANPRNLGQHASIVRGLAAAQGELAVVMDADLQDAPEDLPRLLAAWRPGLGAVFAQRAQPYQPAARHRTGRLLKRLVRRLTGSRLPIGVGTFVLIGREARERVVRLADDRPYLQLLLVRTDLPLAVVAIEKRRRAGSVSAYTGASRFALGLRALWLALRWRFIGK